MADPNNSFSSLPARQKISAVVFFIVGAVILWQVIGMFRSSGGDKMAEIKPATSSVSNASSTPGPTTQLPQKNPVLIKSGMTSPVANTQPASPSSTHSGSPILSEPMPENGDPPQTSIAVQQQQEQEQVKYVTAINELQMLKIQKEIAETNQAIVAAKLATVEAEKSINETLTPTVMLPKPQASDLITGPAPQQQTAMEMSKPDAYVVYSVSMELDQWHAVIGYKEKLYNVIVGDVLPNDGSTVSAIDSKGVTLVLGGMEHRIPLSLGDVMPLTTTTPAVTGAGNPGPELSAPPPPTN